jgi:hypothetical protein
MCGEAEFGDMGFIVTCSNCPPTLAKVMTAFETRTIKQIENAQISGVFGAADRFAEFVQKLNKAIEPTAHPGLKSYVRGS